MRWLAVSLCLAVLAGPVPAQVRYWLDDFDDADTVNSLFGQAGPWADGDSRVEADFPAPGADGMGYCLCLRWHVVPGSVGCGWWMDLSPRWDDAEPLCDLSGFDTLRLALRGTGFGPGARLLCQLQDADGRATEFELAPTADWQWSASGFDMFEGTDPSRARRLAFVIQAPGDRPADGEALLDDLKLYTDWPRERPPASDDALLDLASRRACDFFLEGAHPRTGLVWDTSGDTRRASIASMGYALAAYCIAAERCWLPRVEARTRALRMLTALDEAPRGDAPDTAGSHGFFYHFLDTGTVRRWPGCELSSVDTAILAVGALCCRAYFDGDGEDARLRELADRLYRAIEWPWMLDAESKLFWMEWTPGRGFRSKWDYYTDEALLICLLAIASPTHPVPEDVFYAWRRETSSYGRSEEIVQSWTGSLFTYFSASLWFDLRGKRDRHPDRPVNWWENSCRAARANWQFCMDHDSDFAAYGPQLWGLSAGPGPGGYVGNYGAPPLGDPAGPHHDGTIAPFAAAMALPAFLGRDANPSREVLWSLLSRPKAWGIYGFRDGVNLGKAGGDTSDDWYAAGYIGIDQGMALLGMEDYRTGLVWKLMGKCGYTQAALEKLFTADE